MLLHRRLPLKYSGVVRLSFCGDDVERITFVGRIQSMLRRRPYTGCVFQSGQQYEIQCPEARHCLMT